MIIIPLECNRNIPNINFKSRNITLAVNLWLFVHFIYLSINYFYYSYIALLYRLFCTVWMFLYCYPAKTQNTYHRFKRRLPNWIRPLLRSIRDNKLVIKVWRNLRAVIEQRRREGKMVDNQTNLLNILKSLRNAISDNVDSLWTLLCRNVLPCLISCISVSCLLIHIGCEFTLPIHHMMIMFTYLMLHHYFNSTKQSSAAITNNEPTTPVTDSDECTDKFTYLMLHHYFNSTKQSTIAIINNKPTNSTKRSSAAITNNEPTTPVTDSDECTDKFKYEIGYSKGTTELV